jgi:hypothetical protein
LTPCRDSRSVSHITLTFQGHLFSLLVSI